VVDINLRIKINKDENLNCRAGTQVTYVCYFTLTAISRTFEFTSSFVEEKIHLEGNSTFVACAVNIKQKQLRASMQK